MRSKINHEKIIFIIAGELSGDHIGAGLIHQLKKLCNKPTKFVGVGGPQMIKEGLNPIFDMSEISVMGIFEIACKINKIIKLLKLTEQSVYDNKPSILITIDSPGFNLRIQKKVSHIKNLKKIHYVAPTVWAWKRYRAKQMAKFLDLLLVLFDFEKKYFTSEGLDTEFVGHAGIFSMNNNKINIKNRNKVLDLGNLKIALLPGSRQGEIKKLIPIFIGVGKELSKSFDNIEFLVVTLPVHEDYIEKHMQDSGLKYCLTSNLEEKLNIYSIVDCALCASGTVSLELANYRTPMVVAYKLNWLTWILVRFMVKVNTASIVNIILNKNIISEYFQNKASVKNLSIAVKDLLTDKDLRNRQIQGFDEAIKYVINSSKDPSYLAAKAIIRKM